MTPPSPPERSTRDWLIGPSIALTLLTGEYLAVSSRFDAEPLIAAGGALGALGISGFVGPMFVAVLTGVVLLRGPELAAMFKGGPAPSRAQLARRVVVNLVGFAAFWWLTRNLFASGTSLEGSPIEREASLPLIVAWCMSAALVVASGLHLAAPVGALKLSKRSFFTLGSAAALGWVAWLAGQGSTLLWGDWGGATMRSAGWLLGFTYSDAFVNVGENVIGTERFYVTIAPVCSGFESMGLVAVLLASYLAGFPSQFRFPRALLLVPLGVFLAWGANNLRLWLLVALGTSVSPSLALGAFHSKAGWVLFCLVGLGVAWLGQARFFVAKPVPATDPGHAAEAPVNSTAAFLSPQLALIAVALLTGVLFEPLDRAYSLRIVVATAAFYWFRKSYQLGAWSFRLLPVFAGLCVVPVWLLLFPEPPAESVALFRAQLADISPTERGIWFFTRVLGSTLVVPIAEELAFRAYLLRRLIATDFLAVPLDRVHWLAILASSIAFGLLHGSSWIAGTFAGLLFCLVQAHRGRVSDAIVAHGVANAGVAAVALLAGRLDLWM